MAFARKIEAIQQGWESPDPQAVAPFATPLAVTEENFGRVPRVYIETLRVPRVYIETLKDQAISPSFQKEMYERLPC